MRLEILESGHRPKSRVALWLFQHLVGAKPDDVVKTALYRPEFLGRPWMKVIRAVMRGPSEWTPGERELFGTFVSRLNQCAYCAGVHAHAAAITQKRAITVIEPDRWRDQNHPPRIRAILELLEEVTLHPGDTSRADIDAVRSAGVSDAAIVDALHLAFVFNGVNRMANAIGYDFGDDAAARTIAVIMNRVSYTIPGFLLR
jgi:uncharacterized peroxidase-related enzyme